MNCLYWCICIKQSKSSLRYLQNEVSTLTLALALFLFTFFPWDIFLTPLSSPSPSPAPPSTLLQKFEARLRYLAPQTQAVMATSGLSSNALFSQCANPCLIHFPSISCPFSVKFRSPNPSPSIFD